MSATALESKLHRMAKNQDGGWRVTINTHPNDPVPDWLLKAAPGQRMGVALVPIHDEQNQERPALPAEVATAGVHPAPDAVSPGGGKQEGAAPAPKPKRKWEDMEIVTRAAMMCEDKRAWPIIARITGWEVENVDEAAEAVREYVKCRRREIKLYPLAVARFEGIETEYLRATRP